MCKKGWAERGLGRKRDIIEEGGNSTIIRGENEERNGKGYGSGYRKGMGRGIDCGRLGDKYSLRMDREG